MTKCLINMRIESEKLERLRNIALNKNVFYTDLIRGKIDELINGYDETTKVKAIKIVKELREPFIFFNTPRGKAYAQREKEKREEVANIIEKVFNLGGV